MSKPKTTGSVAASETPAKPVKSVRPSATPSAPEAATSNMSKAASPDVMKGATPSVQKTDLLNGSKAAKPDVNATQTTGVVTASSDVATPGEDIELGEREEMIRQAAYHRYLQRNGAPGNPDDDWRAAEAEIDSPGAQTNGKRQRA